MRRCFAGSAAVALPVGLYTWRIEPHWLEIVRRDLPISRLPDNLNGKTLAHLSDIHIGPEVDDDYIRSTFERTAALNPDFVAVTGDWISYRGQAQLDQLERLLKHFPRGKIGSVGILGNHDYGKRWKMTEVGDAVVRMAENAGVTMLRNGSVSLGGLDFIGLDDFWGPCFSPTDVIKKHEVSKPSIVLCHNPDVADCQIWQGYEGWILSGHTHGGQCKAPFLPPPLLPVSNRRYTSGEFELTGNRRMYISRGVGHLLRVRFNVRPEVTLFRLVGA